MKDASCFWLHSHVLKPQAASNGMLLCFFSGIGLWVLTRIQKFQGVTGREFMQTSIGGIAVWLLSACFAVGLLLVLPISMVVQRRAGEPLPGPTLPNWFARLVNALIIVVIAIMLFFFAGLVMWVITS